MQFTALNPAYQLIVRNPDVDYYPDGRERVKRPMVVADFGEQSLGTETYEGIQGGQPYTHIRGGGFLDTVEAQRQHKWTDEEREDVEERLLQLCRNNPNPGEWDHRIDGYGDISLYEKPVALPPWPTYEQMHHNEVPTMAEKMGLAAEALVYEQRREKGPRPSVVEKLQELVEAGVAEDSLTAA